MFHKSLSALGLALVTGLTPLLLATAPVLAAEPAAPAAAPAVSLEQAGGPLNGSIQIPAQGSQWFKFKYHYDNSDKDNEATQAVVMLKTGNTSAIRFEVWTRDRLQNPQYEADDIDREHGKITPVGHGTPMTIDTLRERNDDGTFDEQTIYDEQTLLWAGSQEATETFYVLVKNTSNAPINYTLSISGPDVAF